MDRFTTFMPFIIEWEGSTYENVPGDPGGPTKYGIDHASHPNEDIRNLTKERATQIYRESYWTPNKCEAMAPGLGECHFNACVNCGSGRAVKLLSASGGSWQKYLDAQDDFYARLAASRPSLSKFLKGWKNRTAALRTYVRTHP